MIRKESEKDSDRPHYYSQFWLDVAAGRRTIGAPRTGEDADDNDGTEQLQASRSARPGTLTASANYQDPFARPDDEVEFDEDEFPEPELEDFEVEDEDEIGDLAQFPIEDTDIPDMDLAPVVEPVAEEEEVAEDEEVDDLLEEEEEEEEEDSGWTGARGRKKPKPSRPTRQPKKPKRETRRGF